MELPELQSLRQRLISELDARLIRLGWLKEEEDIDEDIDSVGYYRNIDANIKDSIGLNASVYKIDRSVGMLPAIGVYHTEVDRLESSFLGLPVEASAAVVGSGLLDLVPRDGRPRGTLWTLSDADDVALVAEEFMRDFIEYGTPFLDSLHSLESMVDYLSRQNRSQTQNGTLAIAAALLGDVDQSLGALEMYRAEAITQHGLIADQSHHFIEAFVMHFGLDFPTTPR